MLKKNCKRIASVLVCLMLVCSVGFASAISGTRNSAMASNDLILKEIADLEKKQINEIEFDKNGKKILSQKI